MDYSRNWQTYILWAKPGQLPVFVNKALSEHSCSIVYTFSKVVFVLDSKVSDCHGDYMVHKSQNIYYLAFYRKSLPTFGIDREYLRSYSFDI